MFEVLLKAQIPLHKARLHVCASVGATLSVVVRDTLLILIDPSGAESPLEAIGPGLFEPPALHTVGNVRLVFGRDATGHVTSLSRITNKVTTMPRIQ